MLAGAIVIVVNIVVFAVFTVVFVEGGRVKFLVMFADIVVTVVSIDEFAICVLVGMWVEFPEVLEGIVEFEGCVAALVVVIFAIIVEFAGCTAVLAVVVELDVCAVV